MEKHPKFTFIDLFSGIGGFHHGLLQCGGRCVMASDIDPVTVESYTRNFGIVPRGDVCEIISEDIPDFDVLCGGFPCQPFSNIGQKGGLEDSRGTLIFQVARILRDKRPKAFILENVKGLMTINKGTIFSRMLEELTSSGYTVYHMILEAKDYGVPQIRKRLFIIGFRDDLDVDFSFPEPTGCALKLSDILKGKTEREYGFTVRVGGRHSGIDNKFNWDCYTVDGSIHYITPEECLQLQGFPSSHYLAGNSADKYRQIGNSVPTTIVRELGKALVSTGVFDPQPP
ncbi:MAG: DNA cytosine methyltransferase [Candidatus Methanoplasma sp.]|jgi:DNA (cytosine-5)-methyltransferase 1|nr:DNA cytosine methyltransferase [Candidatus Methanoplasma sp.]